MSVNSLPKIDQKEYLKKYLSGDKGKKKKKDKKHKKSSAASVKIIDDDINYLNTGPEIDEELLLTGDDAPQIVGEYIQDSPGDKKIPKWRSIVIKDEPDDESDTIKENESNLWGRKSDEVRVKQEFSMGEVRSKRISSYSPSRRKHRNRKSSDASPPRSSRKTSPGAKHKKDKSPLRYRANNSSSDNRTKIKTEPKSPERRENETYNRNTSLSRRNSDQSPPRRRKSPSTSNRYESAAGNTKYSDGSQIRKNKMSDQSPPRRSRRDSDQSPPRRHKSSGNDSPHRKNTQRIETPDNSPPRKSRKTADQSPPRRRDNFEESKPSKSMRHNSNHKRHTPDQSPPRRKHNYEESTSSKSKSSNTRKRTPDQSPRPRIKSSPSHKRREKQTPDLSPPPRRSRWEKEENDKDLSPPPTHKPKPVKTLEGKTSGLQNAKALQQESMERRKKDDILFETMPSDVSGRNAEVQVRSTGRRGRRARAADEEDPEERRRKEDREEKKKILYDRWGKGLKQIEDHKNRMLEQQYESSKPLARYSNDEDLERHLKEQERAEDPMLDYMRKKRQEKEKQSGKPQMPRYEGPYPENRFGIRPGYRWDGVDRSNSYEKKYFAVQSEKIARQDEAYKYSVEDM